MSLSQQQLACLAQRRQDVVALYAANRWPTNNLDAIFNNWWQPPSNHGAGLNPPDEAAAYPSLESYAAAVCAAAGVSAGGGAGTAGGTVSTGSNASTLPAPGNTGDAGRGQLDNALGGASDSLAELITREFKNNKTPFLIAGAFALYYLMRR